MKRSMQIGVSLAVSTAVLVAGISISAQDKDKYNVKVEGGLCFAEFNGSHGFILPTRTS